MTLSRILVVGEAPTVRAPTIFNSHSGRRLARILSLSASTPEALTESGFAFRNLFEEPLGRAERSVHAGDRWSRGEARRRADAMRRELGDAPMILLGKRVGLAFRFHLGVPAHSGRAEWLLRGNVLVVPHPSGANHCWNDAGNEERVATAIREFAIIARCRLRSGMGW